MNSPITTLEELEKEQERQKQLMKITKNEFTRSFSENRKQLQKFLVKKVALPAGALGLGVTAVKQIASSGNGKSKKSPNNELLMTLLPVAVELAHSYFSTTKNQKQ